MKRLLLGIATLFISFLCFSSSALAYVDQIVSIKIQNNVGSIVVDQSFSEFMLKVPANPVGGIELAVSYKQAKTNWSEEMIVKIEHDPDLKIVSEAEAKAAYDDEISSGIYSERITLPSAANELKVRVIKPVNLNEIKLLVGASESSSGNMSRAASLGGDNSASSFQLGNLTIVSRAGWGCPDTNPASPTYCNYPNWDLSFYPTSHIVVHHTATANNKTDWAAEVRWIWSLHANSNGWNDIGYNYLIDPNGVIYEGRFGGEGVTAGHVYEHNRGTVGISMIGTYTSVKPTAAAMNSLAELVTVLSTRYNIDTTTYGYDVAGMYQRRLSGHRDWASTACPGNQLYPDLNGLSVNAGLQANKNVQASIKYDTCPANFTQAGNFCRPYTVTQNWTTHSASVDKLQTDSTSLYLLSGNSAVRINKGTKAATTLSLSLSSPQDLVLANSDRMLINNNGDIYNLPRSYTSGGFTTYSNSYGPMGIATPGAATKVFALTSDFKQISYNNSGAATLVGRVPEGFTEAIVADSSDKAYVVNSGTNTLSKFSTTDIEGTYNLPLIHPNDLSLGTEEIYIAGTGSGEIGAFNPTNNTARLVSKINGQPLFLSVDSSNNIFTVSNINSQVSKTASSGNTIVLANYSGRTATDIHTSGDETFVSFSNGSIDRILVDSGTQIPLTNTVYRFWSNRYNGHFFTASLAERDDVINRYDTNTWNYERVAFHTFDTQVASSLPVYRFWNRRSGRHFYTIDEGEKQNVINTQSHIWLYEGIAFYTYTGGTNNAKAVYRFWSDAYQGHFYTINAGERDAVIANNPTHIWKYEGVAFYAYE